MIGLSLSRCVLDILHGRVRIESVDKIIARTNIRNDADWQFVMDEYCEGIWKEDTGRAVEIAELLRDKIEQPRNDDLPFPDLSANGGHWVKSEDVIKYVP